MNRTDFQWWMRKTHLWLSFSVGIVFVVASVTGGILTYQWEIEYWLQSDLFPDKVENPVSHDEILSSIRQNSPDKRIHMLYWPSPQTPVYRAYISEPDVKKWWNKGDQIYIHPQTAERIVTNPEASTFLSTVNSIHTSLLAGIVGRWIVGFCTAATVIILITGVYLWWPGIRDFFNALWVHTDQGSFRFNYDLHNLMSMVTLPFIFLMCITGVFFTWPSIGKSFYYGIFLRTPPENVTTWTNVDEQYQSNPPAGSKNPRRADIDRILDEAHQVVPSGARTYYVSFPSEPNGLVQVRLQKGTYPWPYGTTFRVFMDQYSAEVKEIINPNELSWPAYLHEEANYTLHVGTIGAQPLRIAYFISCFLAPAVMITGFFIWWLRPS